MTSPGSSGFALGALPPEGRHERGMDTIVVRDTVYYATPVASDSVVMRYETVRVPIYRPTDTVRVTDTVMCSVPQTDSVKVQLPIVQRTYGDSLYTAWVSGYDARLDSLRLYTRSQYSFKVRDKPRRWGVGIGAGVGFLSEAWGLSLTSVSAYSIT